MRTKAIVIKKENTNEYDQLVTCYTEEFGKITAIAKSILKKTSLQAMHLQVFNLAEFELINGKALPIIASAHAEDVFSNLRNSLSALAVAGFFADLIDKLVFDNEKDRELWSFFNKSFQKIDRLASDKVGLIDFFNQSRLEILKIMGYGNSGSSDISFFESLAEARLESLEEVRKLVSW